ncbi:GNAT family N-acetyltransferase [Shimia sp.]|uniref:GNAT family N-acetyltransferase n=1 Tax=Shimia sp. TaxID=1954381 RepID=UPI003562D6C6
MTPKQLATIHDRAFAQSRGWSAGEFADLLRSPLCFLVCEAGGFALGRVIADEAELLTIATLPEARRQGIGRRMLAGFEADAATRGARSAFLEVAADNPAAIALYAAAGWQHAGRRRGYYARATGPAVDALVMTRSLPQGQQRHP